MYRDLSNDTEQFNLDKKWVLDYHTCACSRDIALSINANVQFDAKYSVYIYLQLMYTTYYVAVYTIFESTSNQALIAKMITEGKVH